MHHAYYMCGEQGKGIAQSLAFIEDELRLSPTGNPDVITLRYGLLSVDEARALATLAYQAPTHGDAKALVIAADRLFHEAQNALLKVFEEPPAGTYLFLVVPSDGVLLPTLRSRLMLLPSDDSGKKKKDSASPLVEEFLHATKKGREAIVADILSRAKSDKEEEKQSARSDARTLAGGLAQRGYETYRKQGGEELKQFLTDLDAFIPILYERSAPLKQIFEHLLLVMPKGLVQ